MERRYADDAPLFFAFPADIQAADITDEFMLGPSLLVCPVTKPMKNPQTGSTENTQTIYLPAGDGYGYEKGEYCLTTIVYDDDARTVQWDSEGDTRFRKGSLSAKIIR